jgi:hypothetical protein
VSGAFVLATFFGSTFPLETFLVSLFTGTFFLALIFSLSPAFFSIGFLVDASFPGGFAGYDDLVLASFGSTFLGTAFSLAGDFVDFCEEGTSLAFSSFFLPLTGTLLIGFFLPPF